MECIVVIVWQMRVLDKNYKICQDKSLGLLKMYKKTPFANLRLQLGNWGGRSIILGRGNYANSLNYN